MRCLGEIDGRKPAEQFVAYLVTQGISTHIDTSSQGGERWEIWVRDEDQLETSRELLRDFQSNPHDPKFHHALREAGQILADRAKQRAIVSKNVRRPTYSVSPLTDRRVPPLTLTVVILCCVVSLASNFGRPGTSNEIGQSINKQLRFVSPLDYLNSNGAPDASLRKGQVWRAVTPIFLHLSTWHLVFNVFGMIVFGRISERWLGTPKYALFILIAAIASNLLQGLSPEWMRGNPNFGGVSGVVYGLFGYIWIRSTLNPDLGIMIPFPVLVLLLLPLVIGLSGLIPNWQFADLAHLGGLVVGVATAILHRH
ncbi:MAG: rhomboid family intramembrane serine protease [Pirellulaceae bacterium]|nr:rhomboid family intramembrane serine protease [Pirellulaceae bacterium]